MTARETATLASLTADDTRLAVCPWCGPECDPFPVCDWCPAPAVIAVRDIAPVMSWHDHACTGHAEYASVPS